MNVSRLNLKLTLYFCGTSTLFMLIFYALAYLFIWPNHMVLAKHEIKILKEMDLGRIGIANKIENSKFIKKIYVISEYINYNSYDYYYDYNNRNIKKFYALLVNCYAEERPFIVVFNDDNEIHDIKFLNKNDFMKQSDKAFLDRYLKDIEIYKVSFLNNWIFNIINPYSYAIYQASVYLKTINKEKLL